MASEGSEKAPVTDEENKGSRTSKFRFKSRSRHEDTRETDSRDQKHHRSRRNDSRSRSPDRYGRHHRRRHRSKDRRRRGDHEGSQFREPRLDEEQTPEQTYRDAVRDALAEEDYLDPRQAFQESLFDALADDEGASYWQEVYGQPIHVYGREKAGPEGKLEQMTDDEYAAYVRTQMYEKTHQNVVEERQRREEARRERKQRERTARKTEAHHDDFQERIAESLRKGEARRSKSKWKDSWETYRAGWDKLVNTTSDPISAPAGKPLELPWPVDSGKMTHISKDNIEDFVRHCPEDVDISTLLKAERIRWHPDKIQQRFGGQGLDPGTTKSVTAVFQILDHMWNEMKQGR